MTSIIFWSSYNQHNLSQYSYLLGYPMLLPLVLSCFLGHLCNAMFCHLTQATSNFASFFFGAKNVPLKNMYMFVPVANVLSMNYPQKEIHEPGLCDLKFCSIFSTVMVYIWCHWYIAYCSAHHRISMLLYARIIFTIAHVWPTSIIFHIRKFGHTYVLSKKFFSSTNLKTTSPGY